jgi:1,4-alpha-glucan branching enzyme
VRVWSGDAGYPGDEYYLEFHKQLYPGRLRYWRISRDKADLGRKQPYDPWGAFDRIAGHVRDFVGLVKSTLAEYQGTHGRTGTVVAMYDTELFGHWWFEGPEFLYQCALSMHSDPDIEMMSGGDILAADPARHQISLPEGSWGEGGYHSVWLNADNHWTWEQLYPAEHKMRELAAICKSGDALRVATQAGRELLLAEASDWQFLISTWSARDYAEIRFADHIERFNRLASLAVVNRPLTPEEWDYVADCEQRDAAFPDLEISGWARQPGLSGVPMS